MEQTLACPRCGRSIYAGDSFCAHCGVDISGISGPGAPPSPPSPSEDSYASRADQELQESLRQATLGDYDIYGELGRGGMAMVYLAHEIALDRKVAIKVLSPALLSTAGMAERFLHEARTAARLSHPHIIPIYTVRETERLVYFVMKYVQGRPLDSIIHEEGQLPIPLVRAILAHVGSALAHAHEHGVYHRDVKPSNILIDTTGAAVVTDFGIAKRTDVSGMTMTGQILGTPAYMSPEQCRGSTVTHAADQYSLGVLVYEMLAGRAPFVSDSNLEIMSNHCVEPPPPLLDSRPDCPPALAAAVDRMLEKDPDRRWPSVAHAIAAAQAAPLAYGDPLRAELVQWAQRGERHEGLQKVHTPRSGPAGTPAGQPAISGGSPPDLRIGTPKPLAPSPVPSTPATTPSRLEAPSRRRTGAGRRGLAVAGLMVVAAAAGWLVWTLAGGPGSGQLVLSGLPEGAQIAVDGANVVDPEVELEPGPHVIRIEAPGYAPTIDSITVDPGVVLTWTFVGRPLPPPVTTGVLTVTRLPSGGAVEVDGAEHRSPVELDAGDHIVRLSAPGYRATTDTVSLTAGDTITLAFTGSRIEQPRPRPTPVARAVLQLRIVPFATVFIDGIGRGETDLFVDTLTAGTHRLRFQRDGFQTFETTITLEPGETHRATIRMTRNE